MTYAKGRIFLGWDKLNGLYAYDGANTLRPWCLYLIHKIFRHQGKIVISVAGSWVQIKDVIVWFRRDRKIIAQHFSIGKTYGREIIK